MKRTLWLAMVVTGLVVASLALVGGGTFAQSKVVKIGDLGSKVGVFEGYGKQATMAIQLA